MKLWIVIFIGSRIFAVWHDPMPSGMTLADCQITADRWTESQARKLDPEDQPVFACLRRWFRPRRGELARTIVEGRLYPPGGSHERPYEEVAAAHTRPNRSQVE